MNPFTATIHYTTTNSFSSIDDLYDNIQADSDDILTAVTMAHEQHQELAPGTDIDIIGVCIQDDTFKATPCDPDYNDDDDEHNISCDILIEYIVISVE